MKSNKNIVLIGMMGSGKSSIGKILSKKLNLTFIDIDQKIEETEDSKISEIFTKYGENYFRKIEEKISLKFLSSEKSVISLGGGGFLNHTIRKFTRTSCITVWLKWNSSTLIERLKRNKNRPIISNMNNLEIKKLMEKRSKIYSKSDIKINCEKKEKKEIINKIINLYEKL